MSEALAVLSSIYLEVRLGFDNAESDLVHQSERPIWSLAGAGMKHCGIIITKFFILETRHLLRKEPR